MQTPEETHDNSKSSSLDLIQTIISIFIIMGIMFAWCYINSRSEYNSFQELNEKCYECAQLHNITCENKEMFNVGLYGVINNVNKSFVDCMHDSNYKECKVCSHIYDVRI